MIRVLEDWKNANGAVQEVIEEVRDERPRIDPNMQESERLEYLKISNKPKTEPVHQEFTRREAP